MSGVPAEYIPQAAMMRSVLPLILFGQVAHLGLAWGTCSFQPINAIHQHLFGLHCYAIGNEGN